MKTLEKIYTKYQDLMHNEDNYEVGGGLAYGKFASRRHEDANNDPGKVTLGKAVQMFKKATGLETEKVKEVIKYAVPNMEWHHAGKLPKSYGGGMKKTYFLNAVEICNLAVNWNDFLNRLELSNAEKTEILNLKRNREFEKLDFLQKHATKVVRVLSHNIENALLFYKTGREMQGKYGWFDSTYKSYNLPEYFTGWQFDSEMLYEEFLKM
jgi:hypothetical protein